MKIVPRGRPTVTAGSDHCFPHSAFVRPYVRPSVPTFQNEGKQDKSSLPVGLRAGRVDH